MADRLDLSIMLLDELTSRLPVAPISRSDMKMRCLQTHAPDGVDQLNWFVWQEMDSDRIWIQVNGGIAGIDVWYGPIDRAALATCRK